MRYITRYHRVVYTFLAGALLVTNASGSENSCKTNLWPSGNIFSINDSNKSLLKKLQKKVNKIVTHNPQAIRTLDSAGKSDKKHPALIASRKAFRDSDRAALTAIAYRITKNKKYLDYVTGVLMAWAQNNVPTGHPINETRLEGLIWAYATVCENLTSDDRHLILLYFEKLRTAKNTWKFGSITKANNHKTHQLKMLILLNLILNDKESLAKTVQSAILHASKNIYADGSSIDYLQRDSLFYQIYNLEPWLEIELLTHCCTKLVNRAFNFSLKKISNGEIDNEFLHSTAKIDIRRDNAGFKYAKKNGRFDISRFTRSQWVHQTLPTNKKTQYIDTHNNKLSFYQLRKLLWKTS